MDSSTPYGTPFLRGSLLDDLGPHGDQHTIDEIHNGTYAISNDVEHATMKYIGQLKLPEGNVVKERMEPITIEQHKLQLKQIKENVSSNPPLHNGMWKANAMDDELAEVDLIIRNICMVLGIPLKRWFSGVDCELLKKKGIYFCKKFRTIVLMEADHQNDAKFIAREATKNMCNNNDERINVPE